MIRSISAIFIIAMVFSSCHKKVEDELFNTTPEAIREQERLDSLDKLPKFEVITDFSSTEGWTVVHAGKGYSVYQGEDGLYGITPYDAGWWWVTEFSPDSVVTEYRKALPEMDFDSVLIRLSLSKGNEIPEINPYHFELQFKDLRFFLTNEAIEPEDTIKFKLIKTTLVKGVNYDGHLDVTTAGDSKFSMKYKASPGLFPNSKLILKYADIRAYKSTFVPLNYHTP